MIRTEESTVTRVASRDGTEIAYWTSGEDVAAVIDAVADASGSAVDMMPVAFLRHPS